MTDLFSQVTKKNCVRLLHLPYFVISRTTLTTQGQRSIRCPKCNTHFLFKVSLRVSQMKSA